MGSGVEDVSGEASRWLKRPFAATFDLILSEYAGYTDELLLQVTLSRLHQMRDVILERQLERRHADLMMEEVKLRAICTSIHAAAGNKKGAKEASKIKLFNRPKKRVLPSTEQVERMFR